MGCCSTARGSRRSRASYGKQEALEKQRDYFADASAERDWLDYGARFHAQSNFMLDDIGYRRRRGDIPTSLSPERWLRVAEDRADYQASTSPEDPQPDLFE